MSMKNIHAYPIFPLSADHNERLPLLRGKRVDKRIEDIMRGVDHLIVRKTETFGLLRQLRESPCLAHDAVQMVLTLESKWRARCLYVLILLAIFQQAHIYVATINFADGTPCL